MATPPSPRTAAVAAALFALLPSGARADSEDPPPGPPWVREFAVAQERALRASKPLFVYLTKTY